MVQAIVPLQPHHMPGNPGCPAPAASSSGPCSAYSYQLDGTQNGWCGSPQSTGWPVPVTSALNAQLLLPVASSVPTPPARDRIVDGTTRFSDASGVRYSSRSASVG